MIERKAKYIIEEIECIEFTTDGAFIPLKEFYELLEQRIKQFRETIAEFRLPQEMSPFNDDITVNAPSEGGSYKIKFKTYTETREEFLERREKYRELEIEKVTLQARLDRIYRKLRELR